MSGARSVFVQFILIPAKLLYNCRSHDKGDSQKLRNFETLIKNLRKKLVIKKN